MQRVFNFGFRRLSTKATATSRRPLRLLGYSSLVGYAVYMAFNYWDAREKEPSTEVAAYKLASYRFIPTNAITSLFGCLAETKVPVSLRSVVYGAYAWLFGCDLSEAEPLANYPTLGHFFARALSPDLRPVDKDALLVSPADAQVLACGSISWPSESKRGDLMLYPEQIKGVHYPLDRLIGKEQFGQIQRAVREQGHDLYYCSLYLSPGVCHWIHSPSKWTIQSILRVNGEALSVSPWLLRLAPSIFCLNERMIMMGKAKGLNNLTMIPVGATNVRSVRLTEALESAQGAQRVAAGQPLGWFAMGSAIVLLFTAPPGHVTWSVQPGDRLQIGQRMLTTQSSWLSSSVRSWLSWFSSQ